MKKLMILLAGCFIAGTATARADYDQAITVDELPAKSQQFIREHFNGEKVTLAKKELDFMEVRYEVMFASGKKVEFLRNGDWKEVVSPSGVPAAIVPAKIAAKVADLYPGTTIIEIDRDSRDYEVKLSNKMELTFDKKFNLVDIDD